MLFAFFDVRYPCYPCNPWSLIIKPEGLIRLQAGVEPLLRCMQQATPEGVAELSVALSCTASVAPSGRPITGLTLRLFLAGVLPLPVIYGPFWALKVRLRNKSVDSALPLAVQESVKSVFEIILHGNPTIIR